MSIYNSIYSGSDTVDKLKDLILFMSSKDGKLVTLKEYVDPAPLETKRTCELVPMSGPSSLVTEVSSQSAPAPADR